MHLEELGNDGVLSGRATAYLGGTLSIWQSLKLGGIGSPRIEYMQGLDKFDELAALGKGRNYVNFSIFRKGLTIRFAKRREFWAACFSFDELETMHLHSFSLGGKGKAAWLELKRQHGEPLLFHVPPQMHKAGLAFFKKAALLPYMGFSEGEMPEDYQARRGHRYLMVEMAMKFFSG